MIRGIAAVDDRLGLATDTGIPWSIQADKDYFRSTIAAGTVVMGYATYLEFSQPLAALGNYVATVDTADLRPGFLPTGDVDSFLRDRQEGAVWVIGGAKLFAITIGQVEQLYLTRVDGDFACTKFFPQFESSFELVSDEPSPPTAGIPAIRFQIWTKKVDKAPG
jgi:dihydrofolate reductase